MEIRWAKKTDYEALMVLFNAFVGSDDRFSGHDNDSFERVLASPTSFVYVAEDKGKIIGFATFSVRSVIRYPRPIAELDELFVAAAWQKHGIALMEAVEAKARELGCGRLFIESHYRHEPAHKFYESIGYKNNGYHFVKDL